MSRFLGVSAGPFELAVPLEAVRQILDVGGASAEAPLDPRALGVAPLSLAAILGAQPRPDRPALLMFDGHQGPVVLTTCALHGVFDATPHALPRTVACRWPHLLRGIVEQGARVRLALDMGVLLGLVEASAAA